MKIFRFHDPVWLQNQRPEGLERFFLPSPRDDYHKLYAHMFTQDLEHLVPYPLNGQREELFRVESSDDALAQKIISALDNQYHRHSITDSLRDFLSRAVQQITYSNVGYYYFNIEDQADELTIGTLLLNSNYIFRIGRMTFQYVPRSEGKWVSGRAQERNTGLQRIDDRNVLVVELKEPLRTQIRKLMNKLKVLSDVAYPDLNKLMESPTLENPNPKGGPFDLSVFRRNFDLALARAIRDTGWTARDYTGEEKSDFFTCIMRLRFRRFQIQISEMLLSQFCEQVRVIFRRFRPDFRFDIKAQNQMTIRDIDDMQAQLYAGEISFKDVIDRTYRS